METGFYTVDTIREPALNFQASSPMDERRAPAAKPRQSLSGRGAGNRVRTDDLLITNQLLYQLSYAGIFGGSSAPIVAQGMAQDKWTQ
jgi:hypothetical protein